MEQILTVRPLSFTPEAIFWLVAVSMAAAFVVTLAIAAVDGRTIDGVVSVWAKPLKFELSLAIHAGTIALAMAGLSDPVRHGGAMWAVAALFLAACAVEMGYIIFQAARAEPSHFNVSTPFHRVMFSVMALGAIVIIGAAGAIGLAVAADGAYSFSPALRWAVAIGFVGGTLLTLHTAFTIGANMSPYVGPVPGEGERMALTGWSQIGGDLRVSHFLSTHLIQAAPFAALVAFRLLDDRAALPAVALVAILWTGLTLYEYRVALDGRPSVFALSG